MIKISKSHLKVSVLIVENLLVFILKEKVDLRSLLQATCLLMWIFCFFKLQALLTKNRGALEFLSKPVVREITWVVLKFYTWVFMGYCFAPFALLSVHRWFAAFYNTFFIGHVVWMGWSIYRPIVKKLLQPVRDHSS